MCQLSHYQQDKYTTVNALIIGKKEGKNGYLTTLYLDFQSLSR